MDETPRILSIIANTQGHVTYGNLLREGFKNSSACHVDFHWYTEKQAIDPKFFRRSVSYPIPIPWIRKRNLDFQHFRVKLANSSMAKRLAVSKLHERKYSALHFHTYMLALLAIDLMRKLPTIVSLDLSSYQKAQLTIPKFRWTYFPNFYQEKRVFETAVKIITFSDWARKSVVEDYKIGEEKVKTVYPGVKLEVLGLPNKLKEESQKRFNFLFIGNDFKRKGGYDILKVFLQFFSDRADLHLVTNAPIKCEYPHVYIHKNIKAYTPKWVELYQKSDIFIMPTYFEAFGFVFIEAMAAGLPVIATRINAIPEIVNEGKTGFLIQPGDCKDLTSKIQALMDNSVLRHEMGIAGRKVVEQKFNAQPHCQLLEDMFLETSLKQANSQVTD